MRKSQKARKIRIFAAVLLLASVGVPSVYAQNTPETRQGVLIEPASLQPYKQRNSASRLSSFSGMEVPRYASLKYDKINGRSGPGENYDVQFVYERAGLPVLVIKETRNWRKIRDPQGDEVWVHARMLGARRTGITAEQMYLREQPDTTSQPLAEVGVGVVAEVAACEGDWCRIEIQNVSGWAKRLSIWGADDLSAHIVR